MNNKKRMVGETGYEVINSVSIGNREIITAANMNASDGNYYLKAEYQRKSILGSYEQVVYSSNYFAIMAKFMEGIEFQMLDVRDRIASADYQKELFTIEHCYPDNRAESIEGKVVVINAEALKAEYRRGDYQLFLAVGGFGANGNSRGNAVYGYQLNDGEYYRKERYDVLGVVKELPEWAVAKLERIQADMQARANLDPHARVTDKRNRKNRDNAR